MKRRIVLSGVNFVEAGPLSVFRDALEALSSRYANQFDIIALVHRKELFDAPNIRYLEFPEVKGSWLHRLWFEYFACKKLSRNLDADLWLSMHDMTPNVISRVRAVYCHNPAPFYHLRWQDIWLDPRFSFFHLLYGLLYRLNIKKNDAVVVQQDWMRTEFRRRYGVKRVVVAHPSHASSCEIVDPKRLDSGRVVFFYPAFPRCFKNVELLLASATELLREGLSPFEVWITIKGDENRYAKWLYKNFGELSCVRWLGPVSRQHVQELYEQTDCLVFPSRLETWGLPLSEFRVTGRPILAGDLAYAHEVVGDYEHTKFFSPTDTRELSGHMRSFLEGTLVYQQPVKAVIAEPFAPDWPELFDYLLALPGQAGDRQEFQTHA